MKAVKRKAVGMQSSTTETLLSELRQECENVVALIRRLDAGPRTTGERDDILGELSAAVLHLHTHTKGLDEYLCESEEQGSPLRQRHRSRALDSKVSTLKRRL